MEDPQNKIASGINEEKLVELPGEAEGMGEKIFALREFLDKVRESKIFLLEKESRKPLGETDADLIVILIDAIEKLDTLEKRINEEKMTPEKITEIQNKIEGNPESNEASFN